VKTWLHQYGKTKLVCFLSSQLNPVGNETVNRKQRDGTIIQVPSVPAAISYNKNMGGVDLNDQQRNYYAVDRKSRKWSLICSEIQQNFHLIHFLLSLIQQAWI